MVIKSNNKIEIPITELEQSAFCQDGSNYRTRTLEEEFKSGVRWQKIPTRYLKLSPEEIGYFSKNPKQEKFIWLTS